MYWPSIFLPLIAFLFESYPRLLNRKFGVDVWTHLLYLKEYHRQKGIPKWIDRGFLIPGKYDYPPAFIFILSKLPFKLVEKYEFFFSPFFDVIHMIVMYIVVFQMTGNVQLALLTQLFYLLTPIIVLENSSATPRSLGYTLFTTTFMLLYGYHQTQSEYMLGGAILSGSLIFLSHRFTAQGFLFFSLFFALYDTSWLYVLVFISSCLLAIFLSKGFYLTVLGGHLGNLKFWYKNIEFRFAHQIKGNVKRDQTNDVIFRLYNQFLKFPPFVLTVTNPWTLSAFYMAFFAYPQQQILYQHLLWWVLFSYILALATTWIPSLRFLGEGQRYLELSAFPTAFIAAYIFTTMLKTPLAIPAFSLYVVVGLCSLVTILVIQRKAMIKETMRTITPAMQDMFDYLKALKKKPNLLCIPHQITTNTIYHTDCPVLVNADYTNILQISDIYPYMRKPIKEVMEKYKLDAILLNEDYATIKDLNLTSYTIVKQFPPYQLISLQPASRKTKEARRS